LRSIDQKRRDTSAEYSLPALWVIIILSCYSCGTAPTQLSAADQGQARSRTSLSKNTVNVKTNDHQSVESADEAYTRSDLPPCVSQQLKLFEKSVSSISEYITEFIQGVEQLEIMRESARDDPLGLRRSQMMIFFGDGLIKRLSLLKHLSACQELKQSFYQSRRRLYLQAEKLMLSDRHSH
jgi:hypothetical protein